VPAERTATEHPAEDVSRGRTVRRTVTVLAVSVAAATVYWLSNPHDFFDLKIYMKAMRWWADGNPLYDYVQPDRVQGELYFTYPPFAALLLRPFVHLPLGATIVIFTTLTLVAVAVTTWWLINRASALTDRIPGWYALGLAVPLVLAVESTRETITFGQINMLLVVLILTDLLIAVPAKARWAGVGIGLATALKLFPGIFIVYLLATRRWLAAVTASATAVAATLLAAAFAPADSWRFWTHEVWATGRVGRAYYTGNQSLLGLLNRLSAPEDANRLLWLALVLTFAGYGLWRAARAARDGDELTGLTLTGLVGALASPITWTHHVYWFIPALVILVDVARRSPDPGVAGRRRTLLALAGVMYAAIVYGVVSFYDWGFAPVPTDTPVEFVLRNLYVLLALLLLVMLPIRRVEPATTLASAAGWPKAPTGGG